MQIQNGLARLLRRLSGRTDPPFDSRMRVEDGSAESYLLHDAPPPTRRNIFALDSTSCNYEGRFAGFADAAKPVGANKTYQQKGDRGRMLGDSDEFKRLRHAVEKAHGDRERAIRNVCRLYGVNRLDALQPEARLPGRLARAATASS